MRYEAFCLMDPDFYDTPARAKGHSDSFELARCPAPDGWVRTDLDNWVVLTPDGLALPPQGWKIHVPASLDSARDVLTTVWDYCVPARIAFKFLPSEDHLLLANAKYAPRGSSGKFVTIYPADEAQLETVLHELGPVLAGRPGPYILSDLRWGDGPLYVRYGGFAVRTCLSPEGELVPVIEDPSGRLVPDVRGPVFRVPDWVSLPAVLEPHLAERNRTTVADLPYRIESALHFSNGGGLYTGQDVRTGQRVVLKEARPYAGLTLDGADAVTRQHRERDALERLRGLDCVPALLDHFVLGEHHFLVEEFVEGPMLNSLFVERCPLVLPETSDMDTAGHTAWVLDMLDQAERAVDAVHARGLIVGDLHADNMLVRPDGRLVLIDFEGVADVTDQGHQRLAAPGFVVPRGLTGVDIEPFRDELTTLVTEGTLHRSARLGEPADTAGVARLTEHVERARDVYGAIVLFVQGFLVTAVGVLVGLASLDVVLVALVLPPLLLGLALFAAALRAMAARQREVILADERIAGTTGALTGGLRDGWPAAPRTAWGWRRARMSTTRHGRPCRWPGSPPYAPRRWASAAGSPSC
jgi:tRNA A-37 threonylcarbamoyl transferase component Bud32